MAVLVILKKKSMNLSKNLCKMPLKSENLRAILHIEQKKTGNGHTLNKTSCRRLLRIRFLEEKVNEYFKS